MSFKTVVLVVDPSQLQSWQVQDWKRKNVIVIETAGPSQAVRAMHAVQFDVVLVAATRAQHHDYLALFSTMRLVAPSTRLVCIAPERLSAWRDDDRRQTDQPSFTYRSSLRQ